MRRWLPHMGERRWGCGSGTWCGSVRLWPWKHQAPRPKAEPAGPNQLHIGLSRADDGTVNYEIYGEPERPGDEPPLYGQGCAVVAAPGQGRRDASARPHDPAPAVQSADCSVPTNVMRLSRVLVSSTVRGSEASKRCMWDLTASWRGSACPRPWRIRRDSYVLHPSLMDAALQAAIGLMDQRSASVRADRRRVGARPALPFALDAAGDYRTLSTRPCGRWSATATAADQAIRCQNWISICATIRATAVCRSGDCHAGWRAILP